MKKVVVLALVMLLMVGSAFADVIDLSGMTFEELVALKDQINFAIWNSEKWQEVEVPQGVWEIGKDIPEGRWTIRAAKGLKAYISWGDALDKSGMEISYDSSIYEYEILKSEEYRTYERGDAIEVTWEMKDGQYFIVEEGIALFTPYAGKQSLGFK